MAEISQIRPGSKPLTPQAQPTGEAPSAGQCPFCEREVKIAKELSEGRVALTCGHHSWRTWLNRAKITLSKVNKGEPANIILLTVKTNEVQG